MEDKFVNTAVEYFKNGLSCSESIVKTAIAFGLVPESLFQVSTVFSGGMSSGCLCGAVAGAQMVLGSIYGKNSRPYAKQFIDEFKEIHKATCCRVLTAKYKEFHSPERKLHCHNMVATSAKILYNMVKDKIKIEEFSENI